MKAICIWHKSFYIAIGEHGIQGAPGSLGEKGEPGQDGIPGTPGEKGDQGRSRSDYLSHIRYLPNKKANNEKFHPLAFC